MTPTDHGEQSIHAWEPRAREPGRMDAPAHQTFTCPRCDAEVTEAYFGPCSSCRTQLRSSLGGDQREIAATDYVPKMNVTPNAVATKD